MPLIEFTCKDFRCLEAVAFEPHPVFSLVVGPNASGKTSLLEAIAFLGQGRSFRAASARDLVRHGCEEFLLTGVAEWAGRRRRLGVQHGRGGLRQSVDGEHGGGVAELATALPLRVIDPEVHRLVAGSPEERRRFIDWIAFHVEPGFLGQWRRFRRALQQRNAGLRSDAPDLDAWDTEFVRAGEELAEARRRVVALSLPTLEAVAAGLLEVPVGFDYRQGWAVGEDLAKALRDRRSRDRQAGTTQIGPQRAELAPRMDSRLARRLVSRGQQKLLACAMVIASVEIVKREALREPGRSPLLLLDDPAAELDAAALGRLMGAVAALDSQVIATALTAASVPLPEGHALFHVKQGALSTG